MIISVKVAHGLAVPRETFKVADKVFDGRINRGIFNKRGKNFGRNGCRADAAFAKLQDLLRILEAGGDNLNLHCVGIENFLNLHCNAYAVVDDNSGAYNDRGYECVFNVHSTGNERRSLIFYSSLANPNPSNPNSANINSNYNSCLRNNVIGIAADCLHVQLMFLADKGANLLERVERVAADF